MNKYWITKSYVFKILVFALVIVTPFLLTSYTVEAYEFPKTYFFYIVASTTVFIFLLDKGSGFFKTTYSSLTKNKLNKIVKNLDFWIINFLFANILATLFSVHKYTSIWGYYSRFNGGLISIILLIGLYFGVKEYFTKEDAKKLLIATTLPMTLISIHAIYQFYSIQNIQRVISTFGQPNWLATFLTMTIFISLYVGLSTKNLKLKFLFLLCFILSFWAIWLTFSVSGLLAFLTGLIVFFSLNIKLIKKNIYLCILVTFICFTVTVINPGIFKNKVSDIFVDINKTQNQANITQVESASQTISTQNEISDPSYIRLYLWKGSLKMVMSSPKNFLLGTGPETFPYEFQQFRPKQLNYSSEWEYVFNKPHNFYIEILNEIGLFGLITYIGIIVISLKSKNKYILSGIAAFYVSNIFGFPVMVTSIYFWVYLAILQVYQKNI